MEIFSLFKKSLNDFLNEKLLKTSGNNAKVAGKGNFWMSYFKSVGIWIKMKIILKKFNCMRVHVQTKLLQ